MEFPMRWMYMAIMFVFALATIIFAFQNLAEITVSFLGFSVNTRVTILVFAVYALGAISGGSLFACLRRSYAGAGIKLADPHAQGRL